MELKKNIPCTEKQTGDQLKKIKIKIKITNRSIWWSTKKETDRSHQNLPKMRERELRWRWSWRRQVHYQENASVEMEMELTTEPEGGVDGSSGRDGVGSGENGESESLE